MTNKEISKAAKTAWEAKMDRTEFLQSLPPTDRNFGALQFDRMESLSKCAPPSQEEVDARAKELVKTIAFCRVASETRMPYRTDSFIGRVVSGRMLSPGEQHIADEIRRRATPNDEDWDVARKQAESELTSDELFLKERLGIDSMEEEEGPRIVG
jgi:hypothetical protein